MKKIPSWVWIVAIVSLIVSLPVGIIVSCILLYYLYNHGYFSKNTIQKKPDSIPKTRKPTHLPGQKTPPRFIRKIEFLSNREIRFTNFTSARYMEENGSHRLMDVKNPRNANIYIRLNRYQFDVFIDCEESREQLSFESVHLKGLDITNHYICMEEGNQDDSFLQINYDNQYFTPLEVETLMDFFKDFRIHNKTTKFQEQPIYEDVKPTKKKKKEKKKSNKKVIGIILACLVLFALPIMNVKSHTSSKQEIYQNTLLGSRTNTRSIHGLTYQVNNEIEEDGWDGEYRYLMSNKSVPTVEVIDKTGKNYAKEYTYSVSDFDALSEDLDFYSFKYNVQKKQYDFINLENGKWYHLSGVLDKEDYYENNTNKDLFVDIYVMPTNTSLVQVTFLRTVDDTHTYDIDKFLSTFNFDALNQ